MTPIEATPSETVPATHFDVVTVPIGSYEHKQHGDLPVEREVQRIVALLSELGTPVLHAPHGLTATHIGRYLSSWARDGDTSERNSVLYWLGHGACLGDGEAWLACTETRYPIGDGVAPGTLAAMLRQEWGRRSRSEGAWVVLIIEACGASCFVRLLASDLDQRSNTPERLLLVGAGGEGGTDLGHFRRALESTLRSYGDNDNAYHLADFAGRLGSYLKVQGSGVVRAFDLSGAPPLVRPYRVTGPITAPHDVCHELAGVLAELSDDARHHYLAKAQGAELGELAWHFVGREEERARVLRWLREEQQGLLVVTGRAGSGKSALLGNVLAYTHPPLREALTGAGHLEPLSKDDLPRDDPFDAVLHLTGVG